MIKIKFICVGSLKEKFLKDAFNEYKKRLNSFCKFELIEINEHKIKNNPFKAEIENSLKQETNKIFSKIPENSYVFALCIEGKQLSSEEFAKYIENISINNASCICFIIGSSYGLSEKIKTHANFLLSMSYMTFPHQLARIILCEQIYRVFQINSGGKYHK